MKTALILLAGGTGTRMKADIPKQFLPLCGKPMALHSFELFKEGAVHLMPGVARFLTTLQKEGIPHVVVTHSPDELVSIVRQKHSVLDKIPYWITRHDYTYPKPDPECYQLAISRYSSTGDAVIGFEDTPRGLQALMGTSAKPVLVTKIPYPEIPSYKEGGVDVFESFEQLI